MDSKTEQFSGFFQQFLLASVIWPKKRTNVALKSFHRAYFPSCRNHSCQDSSTEQLFGVVFCGIYSCSLPAEADNSGLRAFLLSCFVSEL
jgi:hypothetical protein